MHRDIQPGIPDGLARRRESVGVAELSEDRDRGQPADPELTHRRSAARLAARKRAQLLVQRRELNIERIDHLQRDRDLLARSGGQRLCSKPGEAVLGHQVARLPTAVVIEHRLDPLLPLAALMRKRVPQPHPGPQIKDVIQRYPRLRQPTDHQQLPHMPSVRTIALRTLLVPPPRRRLGRLREMHDRSNPAQLLSHEPPASRRLQRDLELLTTEPLAEPAHTSAVRRRDSRTRDFTTADAAITRGPSAAMGAKAIVRLDLGRNLFAAVGGSG